MVLHDALKNKRLLHEAASAPIDINTGRNKYYHLTHMIGTARRRNILTQKEASMAHKVRREAVGVLHLREGGANENEAVNSDRAFDVVRNTVRVVEAVLER